MDGEIRQRGMSEQWNVSLVSIQQCISNYKSIDEKAVIPPSMWRVTKYIDNGPMKVFWSTKKRTIL